MCARDTIDRTASVSDHATPHRAEPGLVLCFDSAAPRLEVIPLVDGRVELGRDELAALGADDRRASRRHAVIEMRPSSWRIRDLGSRNGTCVDGARVDGELEVELPRVLRVGDALLLFAVDVSRFARPVRRDGDLVIGPTLGAAWDELAELSASSRGVHVQGPSGAGKEPAARHVHASGPHAGGKFVPVNCAAIVPQLAERLLFGARRGAYSGADADTIGYFQEADGGTLFLDEIAELSLDVQAKLLRAIEAREIVPLGASRPVRVDVRLVTATHADLRADVAAGRFRGDLYFRVARPSVILPALAQRLEDVPHLIAAGLEGTGLAPHSSFVEAAMLRAWPGNVRELRGEIANAARLAAASRDTKVRARHLGADAGRAFGEAAGATGPRATATPPDDERSRIVAALAQANGKVAAAARALGMHRTQLRRLIERYGIRPGFS